MPRSPSVPRRQLRPAWPAICAAPSQLVGPPTKALPDRLREGVDREGEREEHEGREVKRAVVGPVLGGLRHLHRDVGGERPEAIEYVDKDTLWGDNISCGLLQFAYYNL